MGKVKEYSETKEQDFRESYSVSELKKKEVVGNTRYLLEENMFVTSAGNDCKI